MLRAAIRQTLFRQNVSRENLSNFNNVILSRYTVAAKGHLYKQIIYAPASYVSLRSIHASCSSMFQLQPYRLNINKQLH